MPYTFTSTNISKEGCNDPEGTNYLIGLQGGIV